MLQKKLQIFGVARGLRECLLARGLRGLREDCAGMFACARLAPGLRQACAAFAQVSRKPRASLAHKGLHARGLREAAKLARRLREACAMPRASLAQAPRGHRASLAQASRKPHARAFACARLARGLREAYDVCLREGCARGARFATFR